VRLDWLQFFFELRGKVIEPGKLRPRNIGG
jgi:hypothetical protein